MENSDLNDEELLEKIEKGLDLTFKKLLEKKRQTDGVFCFFKKWKNNKS